jgi:hypothetical protein
VRIGRRLFVPDFSSWEETFNQALPLSGKLALEASVDPADKRVEKLEAEMMEQISKAYHETFVKEQEFALSSLVADARVNKLVRVLSNVSAGREAFAQFACDCTYKQLCENADDGTAPSSTDLYNELVSLFNGRFVDGLPVFDEVFDQPPDRGSGGSLRMAQMDAFWVSVAPCVTLLDSAIGKVYPVAVICLFTKTTLALHDIPFEDVCREITRTIGARAIRQQSR